MISGTYELSRLENVVTDLGPHSAGAICFDCGTRDYRSIFFLNVVCLVINDETPRTTRVTFSPTST